MRKLLLLFLFHFSLFISTASVDHVPDALSYTDDGCTYRNNNPSITGYYFIDKNNEVNGGCDGKSFSGVHVNRAENIDKP